MFNYKTEIPILDQDQNTSSIKIYKHVECALHVFDLIFPINFNQITNTLNLYMILRLLSALRAILFLSLWAFVNSVWRF